MPLKNLKISCISDMAAEILNLFCPELLPLWVFDLPQKSLDLCNRQKSYGAKIYFSKFQKFQKLDSICKNALIFY